MIKIIRINRYLETDFVHLQSVGFVFKKEKEKKLTYINLSLSASRNQRLERDFTNTNVIH